jgi:hypothetical protein
VHGLDLDVQRLIERAAPGEHRVHRLDLLARIRGGGGDDGLPQQLAAEDDPTQAGVEIAGPEPPVSPGFEIERRQQSVQVGHQRSSRPRAT